MTDRLSATDAAFLYSEDATTPMHVGGVVILHPSGSFDFQRVLELVASRLVPGTPVPAEGAVRARPAGPPGVDR